MDHDLRETVSLLRRTPAVLNALLREIGEAWTLGNEGENTWTVRDVVGHLVQCERLDWMRRVKMIMAHGEKMTFEPLDRSAHVVETQGRSLDQLLDRFAQLRSENLSELGALGLRREDLDRRGRHPVFGPVTLSELLATWATHDLTHLHQISRIMAHQYRVAVGPWEAYLGVLQCGGHSSQ